MKYTAEELERLKEKGKRDPLFFTANRAMELNLAVAELRENNKTAESSITKTLTVG